MANGANGLMGSGRNNMLELKQMTPKKGPENVLNACFWCQN